MPVTSWPGGGGWSGAAHPPWARGAGRLWHAREQRRADTCSALEPLPVPTPRCLPGWTPASAGHTWNVPGQRPGNSCRHPFGVIHGSWPCPGCTLGHCLGGWSESYRQPGWGQDQGLLWGVRAFEKAHPAGLCLSLTAVRSSVAPGDLSGLLAHGSSSPSLWEGPVRGACHLRVVSPALGMRTTNKRERKQGLKNH